MNIKTRTIYGKTLTCYVNDRPVFSMPISRRQQFDARVKSLKVADENLYILTQDRYVKLARAKLWLDNQRQSRQLSIGVDPAAPCGDTTVYVEHVPTPRENVIAASIARLEGTIERNRQMDEKLIPWLEAGMPVPISSEPIFGGLANE